MKRRKLNTKRLQIRPLTVSDYIAWNEANTLPSRSTYDRDALPATKRTKKSFHQRLKRYEKGAQADNLYVWGVFEKKSAQLIGILDISIISRGLIQKANLGYRVFNRYWRKGYAREFVRIGIILGLRDLKLNRLEAVIDPDNRASIRLAKSVGMEKEGIRRNYYYQEGHWEDQVVYSAYRARFGLPVLRSARIASTLRPKKSPLRTR